MRQVFRGAWHGSVKEQLESENGYPGILKQVAEEGGRFANWHALRTPEGPVERDLDSSVHIGCTFPEHAYFGIFLNWANEAADRALSDDRFSIDPDAERENGNPNWRNLIGWKVDGTFPGNHGAVLAAACFARAMRDGTELDSAVLKQAADEIAVSALHGGSKMWDYLAQSSYLRCVRLALVAGDVAKARHFLQSNRRKFKHTFVHQEWLLALVSAIEAANGERLAAEAVAQFQDFFDQVRDPQAKLPANQPGGINLAGNISLLRLELATIKQHFILRQPIAGNWPAILALISE